MHTFLLFIRVSRTHSHIHMPNALAFITIPRRIQFSLHLPWLWALALSLALLRLHCYAYRSHFLLNTRTLLINTYWLLAFAHIAIVFRLLLSISALFHSSKTPTSSQRRSQCDQRRQMAKMLTSGFLGNTLYTPHAIDTYATVFK